MDAAQFIAAALAEDSGAGDITAETTVDAGAQASAKLVCKTDCVVAGLEFAKLAFAQCDPDMQWESFCSDGDSLDAQSPIATITGNARAILRAERIALNVLQHLSGIATITRHCVDAVADFDIDILDTRKTLPGWRTWQKQAVAAGGGTNHRMGLHDRYLIKSNHVIMNHDLAATLERVRANRNPDIIFEAEVRNLEELQQALSAEVDWVMLDNFTPAQVREAIAIVAGHCKIEVSGGITPDTIKNYAIEGVDAISLGWLTHSVKATDIHLQVSAV